MECPVTHADTSTESESDEESAPTGSKQDAERGKPDRDEPVTNTMVAAAPKDDPTGDAASFVGRPHSNAFADSTVIRVAAAPPTRPTDRHGSAVPTTAGGAGNAKGVGKPRDGPYSAWLLIDNGAMTGKSLWCGAAALAALGDDGDVMAASLATATGTCSHALCHGLAKFEAAGQYTQLCDVLDSLLLPRIQRQPHTDIDAMYWRQLIVTGTVLSARSTDHRDFPLALSLVRRCEHWLTADLDMTAATKKELTALIADAHAYYLFRRNQYQAALDCTRKASKLHIALGQYEHVRIA